jgi:hypothetical protein
MGAWVSIQSEETKMGPNVSANNAAVRNTEADKLDALLIKEMDETNNWARLGAQVYFAWFTLVLTVNGAVAGWLYTRTIIILSFVRLICVVMIILNLMGTIVSFRIRQHLFESAGRIKEVIATLTRQPETEGAWPQSPVPLRAIDTAFIATAAALIMLGFFWVILFIFASRLGAV